MMDHNNTEYGFEILALRMQHVINICESRHLHNNFFGPEYFSSTFLGPEILDTMPASVIGDFQVLALTIPGVPSFPQETKHYLYTRPHEPKITSPDSTRSLFISNVPIDATTTHFRSLFASETLGGLRVERTDFAESKAPSKRGAPQSQAQGSKKRKRLTDEDLTPELPPTWDREIQRSGSSAVVVFADRSTMEAAFRAIKKIARKGQSMPWSTSSSDDKISMLGSVRYKMHHSLRFPDKDILQASVDAYMTAFGEMEQSRLRAASRIRQEPDEDGFVTVTRGARVTPRADAKVNEDLQERLDKKRKKELEKQQGLGDFYRFQNRERKKAQAGDLVKRFEMDRRRVGELKGRRERIS